MQRFPTCPDPVKLAEYARNNLGREDTPALDEHLAACRACLDRFLELGKRSLVPDIPGCHVVKEIGRGRFGAVYKAWWLKDKPRTVALKILTCPGEMEKSRFDREIAVLTKLDSPWIVKCLDSGVAAWPLQSRFAGGDALYYVMDLVEGVHLDEYLEASTHDLKGKLTVFQRVCRGVADAHAKGVVHRDLKPRNILIDADGQPHILDFGICAVQATDWSDVALRRSWARGTITNPGDVIGTLRYMSPEQAWGGRAGAIDERTDIWALGVMLYEIVTDGGYPYSREATEEKPAHEALLERIRKELPRLPRLQSIPRGTELEVLLERCLAWEPDRRLESTAKLAEDLERFVSGKRIKTKPLWMPYRLKRLAVGAASRSRWMFSAAFVAILGMTLWPVTFLFGVGWQVNGYQYQGQDDASAPLLSSPLYQGGNEGGSQDRARDGILIVGVFDDTVDAVVNFASEARIDGVTTDVTTWRAVHGYLMERLAAGLTPTCGRPKAVVWDYYFSTPQPGDARLVSGIRKLEEAGIPVLLAALTYGEDGTPDLSPGITRPLGDQKGNPALPVRCGAIVARDMVQRPGEFVTAIKHDNGTVVPSLALATLAAVLHPDARLDLDWAGRTRRIDLLYEIKPGAYLRERDRIELTRVFEILHTRQLARAGDLLACNTFELVRPERWGRQTIPYQTLLTCPDDELQTLVTNKLIIIGDLRTTRIGFTPDRHPVKFGTSIIHDVPGCYLLADAVAGLLERRYVTAAFPLSPLTFVSMLLVAAVGCLLPIRLATRKELEKPFKRRLLLAALLALSASCVFGMTRANSYTGVHLAMGGLSLFFPMIGAFWVEFIRNRHRIADPNGNAFDNFVLTTGATLTMPRRRRRSLQDTR